MKIELIDLTLERPGGIVAVEGASYVFDSGRCASVAVLGANGAGKSTLLESIPGLVRIRSGAVVVDGVAVGKKTCSAVRKAVGMVFQNSDDQLFSQTVAEDVAFGPTNLELPPEEVRARVEAALELMDISSLADREITRLSCGEKRRAAIAGVLAMRPGAILLDEPTSMLDPRACRELAEHLETLPALKIVATHDLTFARRVCPECLILRRGKIAASGRTGEVLDRRDLLRECGLE